LRLEVHFDESGTDADELTLAGYIFQADRIDQFAAEWNKLLNMHSLPFLHMRDFAPGNVPFKNIDNRIRLQMQFMSLIKKYTVNGIVCNIRNNKDNRGQSYLDGVKGAVKQVLNWVDQVGFEGKIAYYFEAGATGQGLAESYFREIAEDSAECRSHFYAYHEFVKKDGGVCVQAADFLAWQYHNFTRKRSQQNLARLDMRALLRHPHLISDECGDPPRKSKTQSVVESKSRKEIIHYLLVAEAGKQYAEMLPDADFTLFVGQDIGVILACPNCFRAVAEDCAPKMFSDIVIHCWCKTRCLIPPLLPPYVRY
jgi:hypothetical protein